MANAPKSPIARRLDGVSESATLKLNAAVQAMKARGEKVVNLTAGEPDFNEPEEADLAVIEAARAHRSKYTPVPGIAELRAAVAEKTNHQQPRLARAWSGADVVVTNGGKQALFNAFMALLDPGDEVLLPAPYWLSYPEMAKIAGGVPKFVAATFDQGFKIAPAQLEAAIGPKTKILVLNSPSNPTGAMYTRDELKRLAAVLERPEARHVWVVTDEIYDRIVLGATPFCSLLDAAPALQSRAITVNGLSKSGAMTGWRVGWSVAPAEITRAMVTLQGQSTSGINALAQWASVAVLKMPDSAFAEQVEIYRRRRDAALEILRKNGKIEVSTPDGAFYLFVGVRRGLRAGEESIAFAERLLDAEKVAVVPGTPFGESSFVRLSFATDDVSLQEGCERLARFVG